MKYFSIVQCCLICLLLLLLSSPLLAITDDRAGGTNGGDSRHQYPLQDLEAFVSESPESLIIAAEIEENLQRLERQRAVSGLHVFGGSGIGHYREAMTEDRMRDYDQIRFFVGLSYPLLGTRAKEHTQILKAEETAWSSKQQKKITRLKALEALRSQYSLLWGTQEKIKISRAFLVDEAQVRHILEQRYQQGLLLEADRQEFFTAFALVHREIANLKTAEQRAQSNINLLTNRHSGNFLAEVPDLPQPELDSHLLHSSVLNNHPDIIRLRGLVDKQFEILNLARHSDIQARISLTGNTDIDHPSHETGYGVNLQFSMDAPWEFSRAARAEVTAERAHQLKLQRQLDQVSSQLLTNIDNDVERYRTALENRRFAARRVKAALERVRERTLRRDTLPGDTFEQLQYSRHVYYQTAMDYVDAEVSLLQGAVRLLTNTEIDPFHRGGVKPQVEVVVDDHYLSPLWQQRLPDCQEKPPVAAIETSAEKVSSECLGVYVWNTEKLFTKEQSNVNFWLDLQKNGFQKLLLSFDRSQLNQLKLPIGKKQLQTFIHRAKDAGVSVGLLLGEPTWILPEYRQDLLDIIDRLQGFDFSVIHLDLEPNQLEHLHVPDKALLAHLLRTVQAVSRLTSLPVEIDLHPRYLLDNVDDFCLGCGLQNLDNVAVTLMIYINNTEKVADITKRISSKFPQIPLSIAQSVEPQLADNGSFAGVSKENFLQQMKLLHQQLDDKAECIYIQSWQDYMDMHDEN